MAKAQDVFGESLWGRFQAWIRRETIKLEDRITNRDRTIQIVKAVAEAPARVTDHAVKVVKGAQSTIIIVFISVAVIVIFGFVLSRRA
jgi:hypothetical protein